MIPTWLIGDIPAEITPFDLPVEYVVEATEGDVDHVTGLVEADFIALLRGGGEVEMGSSMVGVVIHLIMTEAFGVVLLDSYLVRGECTAPPATNWTGCQ